MDIFNVFYNTFINVQLEPLMLILALIVIDYILGIIGAIVNDDFSSTKMRQGLFHKMAYLVILIVALIVQRLGEFYDLGIAFTAAVYGLVCTWIIITEIGSILENLTVINPKFADNDFMKIFAKTENNSTKDDENA